MSDLVSSRNQNKIHNTPHTTHVYRMIMNDPYICPVATANPGQVWRLGDPTIA